MGSSRRPTTALRQLSQRPLPAPDRSWPQQTPASAGPPLTRGSLVAGQGPRAGPRIQDKRRDGARPRLLRLGRVDPRGDPRPYPPSSAHGAWSWSPPSVGTEPGAPVISGAAT